MNEPMTWIPTTTPTVAGVWGAPGQRIVPECYGDVCITCSDEAVEVQVVEVLDGGLARVNTGAGIEEVSVALVDAGVGDTILVHAKEAIAVVVR
jgi:hydrogenase expression/formation protein HypC